MQKVQTSLFKGMCALTSMINKLVDQIPLLPVGNNMLQEATDAFAMVANANSELNHRRRELIKLDLHNDYKHLSFVPHQLPLPISCLGMTCQNKSKI